MISLKQRIKKQIERFGFNHKEELCQVVISILKVDQEKKEIEDSDIMDCIDSILFGNPKFLNNDF